MSAVQVDDSTVPSTVADGNAAPASLTFRTSAASVVPTRPGTGERMALRRSGQVGLILTAVGATVVVLDGTLWWAAVRVLIIGLIASWALRVTGERAGRVASAVVAALGLLGVAAGIAIAVSYWGTAELPRAVGGVLLAVGGAMTLAFGIVLVVRRLRRWWRLLVLPALVLTAYALAVPVGIAVFATNVGRPDLGSTTPADRGFDYVDAGFTTSDGVTLSGWYIPSRNGAAVVVLHGASSTRSAVLDQAVVLASHGYGVLLYDARGMGESGGRAMNFGWYGDRDIAAALDWLTTRPDVDPDRVAALGESMGGEQALGALASDRRLRAVIAEGATNRVADDWDWLSNRYGMRGLLQEAVQSVTYGLTDLLTDAQPPIGLRSAVAAGKRPVLLITAGNVPDETNAARYIRDGAPTYVDIWSVPGADHTGGLTAQPDDWERHVIGFLASALEHTP